ncbi:hypothetical protein QBC38DRAFT_476131 [Podospora fimiseda]|uniref:C2H2-type domain-containing protein n=1 Tax=Podospora fimiseda TaxID=252190 RepID=A0AAN7BRB9_9PEZI|nr:hypothetical protein QBC38DRAFT_476131 [Podospora fimiseda]
MFNLRPINNTTKQSSPFLPSLRPPSSSQPQSTTIKNFPHAPISPRDLPPQSDCPRAKKYTCDFEDCTYACDLPKDLKKHKIKHSNTIWSETDPVYTYVCPNKGCNRLFGRRDNGLRHTKNNCPALLTAAAQSQTAETGVAAAGEDGEVAVAAAAEEVEPEVICFGEMPPPPPPPQKTYTTQQEFRDESGEIASLLQKFDGEKVPQGVESLEGIALEALYKLARPTSTLFLNPA